MYKSSLCKPIRLGVIREAVTFKQSNLKYFYSSAMLYLESSKVSTAEERKVRKITLQIFSQTACVQNKTMKSSQRSGVFQSEEKKKKPLNNQPYFLFCFIKL